MTLREAVNQLRDEGYSVEATSWGLWLLNGRELTANQVIDFANRTRM